MDAIVCTLYDYMCMCHIHLVYVGVCVFLCNACDFNCMGMLYSMYFVCVGVCVFLFILIHMGMLH